MPNAVDVLPNDIDKLKDIIFKHQSRIIDLEEQLNLHRARIFGRSSEKSPPDSHDQINFFGSEDIFEEDENSKGEVITVPEHKRKKSGRKPIPDNLPRKEIIHDISEEEKKHSCGKQMKVIGQEEAEKIRIIPESIIVEKHIRLKYGCTCDGSTLKNNEPAIKIAPSPPQLIAKSMATPSLLAYIMIAKFCDGLPFYRQEKIFLRRGINITTQNMSSWAIKLWENFGILKDLMIQDIRGGPLINMDETRVQVLNEPGKLNTSLSQMWVTRGAVDKKNIIVFHYSPNRKADNVELILGDYSGYLQTDGFPGYDKGIKYSDLLKLVGCWAHLKRKFNEVIKGGKSHNDAHKALSYIKKLYKIESEMKSLKYTDQKIVEVRQKKSTKILKEFKEWLDDKKITITPSSGLGKAITYALNQWDKLNVYLEAGYIRMDNNLVENAIRPYAVGRKNWLFNNSPEGAHAAAFIYSLIETAKANDLEPYWYTLYLFESLPLAKTEDDYRKLLPYNVSKNDLQKMFLDTMRFN